LRHEPDNRFLECAFAANADFIITVNTARGHFDQKKYQSVGVLTPGEFLKLREVKPLLQKLAGS
jgi:predicted nucleic acid-binding protein